MEVEGDWRDLQTRGFVVVRDFLSPEIVSRAAEDARQAIAGLSKNSHKGVDQPGMYRAAPETYAPVEPRIQAALAAIRRATDIQATDIVSLSAFYFTLPTPIWHTDRFPYFLFQNLYQYVNFWIPIVKPDPNDAGLMVVPMDTLAAKDRPMFEAVHTRGGAHFIPTDVAKRGEKAIFEYLDRGEWTSTRMSDETLLYEGDGQVRHVTSQVDVEELAVAPSLSPGDLMITRGDVLHRGQGAATNRIALSVRAVNGAMPLRKDWFLGLSEFAKMALARPKSVATISVLGSFAFYEKDTVTARELLDFNAAVERKEEPQVRVAENVSARALELLGRSASDRVSV